jgi:crotonobetaine/carnitine-CoA ligase
MAGSTPAICDLGTSDRNGYFYFRGRMKDTIRVRGENVSAAELEAIADTHPAVQFSAAIAVPAELGEDDILLYVEPRPGTHVTGDALFAFLEARTAKFMLPRYIRIIESLPRTATEKIKKTGLRADIDSATWVRPLATAGE